MYFPNPHAKTIKHSQYTDEWDAQPATDNPEAGAGIGFSWRIWTGGAWQPSNERYWELYYWTGNQSIAHFVSV